MKITCTAVAVCIISALGMAGCGSSQQVDEVSVLHHFKKGNEAYRIEDYRRAIIHFNRALELNPQSPDIQYNLGLAHYRAGNYKDAVAAFMAAIRARPSMGDAHYNLALAHDRLFNADAAHSHYNKYRSMMIAQPQANSRPGAAPMGGRDYNAAGMGAPAVIPAVGKRSGTMVNGMVNGMVSGSVSGSGTPNRSAALSPAAGAPATGNSPARMGGRPIPKGRRPLNGVPPAGAGVQGAAPRASAKSRPAARPAPHARPAATYAPASQRNTQQPSGDQQKWWIQDRLNQTR